MKAAEKFTRNTYPENADKAEAVRTAIKRKLKEEDSIDIIELSQEMFSENHETKENLLILLLSKESQKILILIKNGLIKN